LEVEQSSWVVDDPTKGYSCSCWMLLPGETCRGTASFLGELGPGIEPHPGSCSE